MKLLARLLLIAPFALFTIFYLRFELADNRCFGLVSMVVSLFYWVALIISFIIAVVATFRKRPSEKFKAEPFSLTALLIVAAVLIISQFFGESLKGGIWIRAESVNSNGEPSRQTLTFRKNRSFVVTLGGDDFGCQYTGSYQLVNDTIILDRHIVNMTEQKLATHYLIKKNQLLPYTQETETVFKSFDILKEN